MNTKVELKYPRDHEGYFMMTVVGDNIRKYRKEAGLTQVDLARRLGIIQANITRWETGRITPSIETLQKLSKLLNVSVDNFLLTRKEKKNLKVGDKELLEKIKDIEQFSAEDRTTIVTLIDALKLKSEVNGGSKQSHRNPNRPR